MTGRIKANILASLVLAVAYLGSLGNCAAVWTNLSSGMNDDVRALAITNGNLYAGGWFTTAGGNQAKYVAKWDGSSWSPLGDGMDGPVYALAVAPDGSLYAGGYFTWVSGTLAICIAKWDGSSWSPLGDGVNQPVNALAVAPDGSLYAGGVFTWAGGISANYVAKWDGFSWSPLGDGLDNIVNALALAPDGSLYAGGKFTTAGGNQANYVAKWNGSSWSPLGDGLGNVVDTLVFDTNGSLYVGGAFTNAGGVSANYVAKWDGSSWSALGNGLNMGVTALAVATNGSLYAGGGFTTAGGVSARNIAKWLPGQQQQVQLEVSSLYGQANPEAGTHTYDNGAAVTCSVIDSPITIGTTQYVCTGWTGSGSVPASGTTTNTGEFTITAGSTITWDWSTNYYLNLTTGGEGGGTLDVASGWFFAGSNITITATPSQTNFFVQWGGDTAGATINGLQITFALGGPKNITATFLKYRVPAFSTWALIACGLGLATFMWLKFRRLAESA